MAGIYGDMLLAWPEQQRTVTVFDMKPKINGGWEIVQGSSAIVIGIYQNTRGNNVKESNGNLVQTRGLEFWTHAEALQGKFLAHTDGEIYRLNASNDWSFEGGFYRYSLEKVVGNNATESDDAAWNIGGNSFS